MDLAVEKLVVKVILPRGQTTAIAVSKDSTFNDILERICQKRNIPINKHVLFINVLETLTDNDDDEVLEPQMESILVDLNQKLVDFDMKSIELCEDQHAEVVQPRPAQLKSEQKDGVNAMPSSPTRLVQERRLSRLNGPTSPIKLTPSTIGKEEKVGIKSFFGKYTSNSTTSTSTSISKKKKNSTSTEKKLESATQSSTEKKQDEDSSHETSFKSMSRNMIGSLRRSPTVDRKRESVINNGTGFDNLEFQANQVQEDNVAESIAPWDDPVDKNAPNNMDDIAPFAVRPNTNSQTDNVAPFALFKTKSEESSIKNERNSTVTDSDSQQNTVVDGRLSMNSLPLSEDMSMGSNNDSRATIRKKASMQSMTLRKQTLTKKSKSAIQHSNESYILEIDSANPQQTPPELTIPANIKMIKITVNFHDHTYAKTNIRCSQDTVIEDILKFICEKKGYDITSHSMKADTKETALELDRPLSYYFDKFQILDYTLIKGEKEYTITTFSDGENDVSIYQKCANENPLLMAATIDRLLEILTSSELCNEEFLDTFLMCYRSLLKPIELFDTILSRFDSQLPENATAEEADYYKSNIFNLQSQVLKIFDIWIVKYWFDFAVNSDLKNDLIDVLDSLSVDPQLGDRAISLIEAVASENEKFENLVNISKASNNKSKSLDSMLMQYSFDDISEQMCLVNSQLYQSIHPIEFLNYIWRKKGEEEEYPTPMLDRFISRFDNESYWVATEICDTKDLKKRTQILTQFIMIAKKCVDSNNFFSAFSLLGGLSMLPVERLKKTWKGLSNDTKRAYEEVQKFCDPSKNMKNYRDKLGIALPPIVPFLRIFMINLAIYLKDLTFLNDGNEKRIRNMYNFDKLRMMRRTVLEVMESALICYPYMPSPHLQNFLKKPRIEKDFKILKELSKVLEPQ